jgi:hypothetical protein
VEVENHVQGVFLFAYTETFGHCLMTSILAVKKRGTKSEKCLEALRSKYIRPFSSNMISDRWYDTDCDSEKGKYYSLSDQIYR